MCLIVDFTLWQKVKYFFGFHPKTKKDVEVYVIRILDDGTLYSPFMYLKNAMAIDYGLNWMKRKVTSWKLNVIKRATKTITKKIFNLDEISSGWFHSLENSHSLFTYFRDSFRSNSSLLNRLIFNNQIKMYRAVIPEGTSLYLGTVSSASICERSYASKRLKLVEDITELYRECMQSYLR